MSNPALRRQVINLYKDLLHLGREYPKGYAFFRHRLHDAFLSRSDIEGEEAIQRAINRAEFVKHEIEALYYLKRYRTLRQRYPS